MEDYSMFVPNVHFEQIPIKNLVSNQEYQRNISEQHVLNAAAHFDLYQINPVKVSRRNGVNYVFNGQHTVEIVALASGSRETLRARGRYLRQPDEVCQTAPSL